MCRILGIEAEAPVEVASWVRAFALACRESPEFQGHGWGASWWVGDGWRSYRSLRPIWEDAFTPPLAATVLVHARSAFRNEGIELVNNMPFADGDLAFAFNGELRGVRLSAPGRTGAARLFHLLGRFRDAADGDTVAALARLDALVARRTEHVRAMNAVVADGPSLALTTRFSPGEAEYFTMHTAVVTAGPVTRLVTSERIALDGLEPHWSPIPNLTTGALVGVSPTGEGAASSPGASA